MQLRLQMEKGKQMLYTQNKKKTMLIQHETNEIKTVQAHESKLTKRNQTVETEIYM